MVDDPTYASISGTINLNVLKRFVYIQLDNGDWVWVGEPFVGWQDKKAKVTIIIEGI
jgi:hypothetical protein